MIFISLDEQRAIICVEISVVVLCGVYLCYIKQSQREAECPFYLQMEILFNIVIA